MHAYGATAGGMIAYAAMAVLWGIPYLFIKEAVDTFSPAAVVRFLQIPRRTP